eukprot:FR737556.1.p3 GENE.FR737556.1~~FR737556.1.p3  ORF type:complete len:108 (-),score=30.03 FR737556.1:840-1118(-)
MPQWDSPGGFSRPQGVPGFPPPGFHGGPACNKFLVGGGLIHKEGGFWAQGAPVPPHEGGGPRPPFFFGPWAIGPLGEFFGAQGGGGFTAVCL